MTKMARVSWPGREQAELKVELDSQLHIQAATLTGIGGPRFLTALKSLRARLHGEWAKLELPSRDTPEDILLRELLLRARGEWVHPYQEDELCHCRSVPTEVVDQAICHGAFTPQRVSAQTSASTACGTCRPSVEAMIKYRLRAG